MFYGDELIENIKSANDIVDVVSSYVKIKKKGATYFGPCPFHNETAPSFSVNGHKQMFYCFGCGAGGDVFAFIMKYENYSFMEALTLLANRAGITLPEQELSSEERSKNDKKAILLEINKLAATYFYKQLMGKSGSIGLKYFLERGLTKETITKFGLGYANKTSDDLYRYLKEAGYSDNLLKDAGLVDIKEKGVYDRFWNRVMFPIIDVHARVIGFGGRVMGDGLPKYVNSPESLIFDKSRNLYGLNFAKTSRADRYLLCEGYMDVIALHQAGFTNAVASLGTAFTSSHAMLLQRYVKKVVLTYDSDGAGIGAAKRAIPILNSAGIQVKVLSLHPYKDPDEFIHHMGAEAFEARIKEAKNSFLWEIDILANDYQLSEPDEKTQFHKEIATRLCGFSEKIERENYMQAICERHMIDFADMKQLVSSMGNEVSIKKEIKEKRKEMKKSREEKEDGLLKSQRLLLTWMIEDEMIYQKLKNILLPTDFTDVFYIEVATKIYEIYESGKKSLSSIMHDYIGDIEKQQKVAHIFNTTLATELSDDDKKKAVSESVIKIKKANLDKASREVADIRQMQEIFRKQAELSKLNIAWD